MPFPPTSVSARDANASPPPLPEDVMLPIFFHLDLVSLLRCQMGCKSWFNILADHDKHLWKPKVAAICAQNLLPRRRRGELWKDIYETYHVWQRPLEIRRIYHSEVPVLVGDNVRLPERANLPPAPQDALDHDPSRGAQGLPPPPPSRFAILAAVVSSRDENGKAVLAPGRAAVCPDRIVYVRHDEVYSMQIQDDGLLAGEEHERIEVGAEPRIDAGTRSSHYAIAGVGRTIFRNVETDEIAAVLEDQNTEEGVLCGDIYAVQSYDAELMRSSLSLLQLPHPTTTSPTSSSASHSPDHQRFSSKYAANHGSCDGPSPLTRHQQQQQEPHSIILDHAKQTSVPRVEPFATIDHIDDSLNAVILNDHFLAYRTWSSNRIHPIIVVRWKDQSEYATLLLDDMDEHLVLHLVLSRLHLIVLCGTGHYVYVYDLATMKRLHSFNLFDLVGDLGSIDWVQLTPDEQAIVFGVDGGCLLWVDIRERRAVLYYRATHEENSYERGIWLVYRAQARIHERPHEQVVCRVFDGMAR
ncbi:hypothetical protein HKX48_002838 [Thoreauomyces humboldtii]|nr:hypothetical protein HKX48_002838 [Thoreauomyces humboldtii]